jgi:glycolate oxidase FAD binding subunit
MAFELPGAVASHPATEADAVDGVQPELVAEPATVEEAADVLREATAAGKRVICRGAGTKLSWGNPPTGAEIVLSTVRLDRVLEHAEGDLIVKAEAGVPLEALQAAVGKAGQQLALDPRSAGEGATLGGIVAANASGSWRFRYGTVRDLLIGITVVLADGTIAHAGGKVVKNVAGYDLGKLFTGSMATLGLIAEVTFRLHPRTPDSAIVRLRLEPDRPEQAGAAVAALLGSQLVPTALDLHWPDPTGHGTLLVTFQGTAPGPADQAKAAAALLREIGESAVGESENGTLRPEGDPPDLNLSAREPWLPRLSTGKAREPGMLVKAACVPSELPGAIRDLWEAAGANGLRAGLTGQAGSVVLYASFDGGGTDALAGAVGDARKRLAGRGGSLVVLGAPLEVKRRVDVWGPVGDALPLMRRVKERFDPNGTMSPGRFVGGI